MKKTESEKKRFITGRKLLAAILAAVLALSLVSCAGRNEEPGKDPVPEKAERNGEAVILFTSDIHCAVDQGFGLDGVVQVREALEAQGYDTLLVDNGDSYQGEAIGTLTRGEAVVKLMNAAGYDVTVPGNHDFDFSVERFLELKDMADHPVVCCNFMKEGKPVLSPYVIKEAAGMKIAFIGITTPETLNAAVPKYFRNDAGEFIYEFQQDSDGTLLYKTVQDAVDSARAEGADYVYVLAHLGNSAQSRPWTYADIAENTTGIDVILDGHSHDTDQVVMKDKDGNEVKRSACGTKLSNIGYSFISPESGVGETGIWNWNNNRSASRLFGIRNSVSGEIDKTMQEFNAMLSEVVASTQAELTINDPVEKDGSGNPIRIVRQAETNLGDLVCDSMRVMTGADIALENGGGIRTSIPKGDITYGNIINVVPYSNEICMIEATGQQILDALEWGARMIPAQNPAFLQVSGITYDIDASVPSGCRTDEDGRFAGVEGARRVSNVKVAGEAIDPGRKYTVAGTNYLLLNRGDGQTAFDGCEVLIATAGLDNQLLIDYIKGELGGIVEGIYLDPYGEGRITIKEQ